MKPKPLPARLRKKRLADMPTLEEIRDAHPTLKVYQLRDMLRDVTCYRCPDGSVRYVTDEAAEALSKPPPTAAEREDDEDEDEDEDLEDEELTPRTRAQAYNAMMNEQLKASAEQRRATTELLKVYESGFRAMIEPMKMGCSMLVDAVKELREVNKGHNDRWDKVLLMTESLASNQHERDLERQREQAKSEFRKGLGVAVIEQLPGVISKLQTKAAPETPPISSAPTTPPSSSGPESPPAAPTEPPTPTPPAPSSPPVAALALDAIGCLEVEFFDTIASNLEPAQQLKWGALRTALQLGPKLPEPPEAQHDANSLNHAPSPPA